MKAARALAALATFALVAATSAGPLDDLPPPKPVPSLDDLPPPIDPSQVNWDQPETKPKPNPFQGWQTFGRGNNSSVWYYFPDSVKPIHHVQTGKWMGIYVWGGWQNPDGSYFLGQYSIFCTTGRYDLFGAVEGNAAGVETAGGDALGSPYRPNTFAYLLASKICPTK